MLFPLNIPLSKQRQEAGLHTLYIYQFYHSRVIFLSRAKFHRGQCQTLTVPPALAQAGKPRAVPIGTGLCLKILTQMVLRTRGKDKMGHE